MYEKNLGKFGMVSTIELFEGRHEVIVPTEKFYMVQEILNANKSRRSDTRYLLSGFLLCHCGNKMYGTPQRKKETGKIYAYYKCSSRKCNKKINLKKLDRKVLDKLSNMSALISLNDVEKPLFDNREVIKK